MILAIKLVWGLLLSVAVGYHFNEAWEKEHGRPEKPAINGRPHFKDTYIWVNPTTFLWVIVLVMTIFLIKFSGNGISRGIGVVTSLILNMTIYFSVYFVGMLLLMPYLRCRISSRACATLWFCPAFMFYSLSLLGDDSFTGLFTIYVPKRVLRIVMLVWLAGFVLTYALSLFRHLLFKRKVMAEAYAVADETTLAIWNNVCEELEFTRPTALLVSPFINSPLSMGRTKRTRCTVLPQREYSEAELKMIFLHEAHHLQRWDVDTKIAITVIKCACWFNPMVHIAAKYASQDLELSCDEIVTEQMSPDEKKSYAGLLLSSASSERGFTTCLSASAGALRYRLKNVIQTSSRSMGKWAIMIALFVSVLCYNTISFTDERAPLKAFVLPQSTGGITDYEFIVSNGEATYSPISIDAATYRVESADYNIAGADDLFADTIVEHFLSSANIYIDEEPLQRIFLRNFQGGSGYRLVTFYEHFVTISDCRYAGDDDRTEVYRIVKNVI